MKGYLLDTHRRKQVRADHVVVATNSPINSRFLPHLKQAAYRTYVIAGKTPKNYVKAGLYYDTLDPYHYIRIAKRLKQRPIFSQKIAIQWLNTSIGLPAATRKNYPKTAGLLSEED